MTFRMFTATHKLRTDTTVRNIGKGRTQGGRMCAQILRTDVMGGVTKGASKDPASGQNKTCTLLRLYMKFLSYTRNFDQNVCLVGRILRKQGRNNLEKFSIGKIPIGKNFKSLPQRTDARVWEFCSKRRSVGFTVSSFSYTSMLQIPYV